MRVTLIFTVHSPDSVGVRNEVVAIVQESEKPPADRPCNKQVDSLKTTPLPEDLMLNTLIPTYLSGIQKSLNFKTMELVSLLIPSLTEVSLFPLFLL